MAHLALKNGVYHARFRYAGKEYRKSLKTGNEPSAQAALHSVELVIHRLTVGQAHIPEAVDPGDFILSGGTLQKPRRRKAIPQPAIPSLEQLIAQYLPSLEHHTAQSYRDSQAIHLRHLTRYLSSRAKLPSDRITADDLEAFLRARLKIRHENTACRERNTVRQLFQWAVDRKLLKESPAAGLTTIKSEVDLPPFHTVAEIEDTIARGGLNETEQTNLWNCLYLCPAEIAQLLETVRQRAKDELSLMLHTIPAYTGMRRGEVLKLRWSDIDLPRRTIVARSRKQSRTKKESIRIIDVHLELQAELASWRQKRPKGQFVISSPGNSEPLDNNQANRLFWQPLRGTTWCLNSSRNWFKIGFHAYRHSFASNLAAAGVDQRIIDSWMGHQTKEMRLRYQHLFPNHTRDAMERFSLRPERTAQQT